MTYPNTWLRLKRVGNLFTGYASPDNLSWARLSSFTFTGTNVTIDLPSWLLDDVALLPVNMIRRERRARDVSGELVRRLAGGELDVAVQTYDLADTAAAIDDLRAGRVAGRAVVLP